MEDARRDFGTFHNGEVANSAAIQYWSALFTRNCNFSYKLRKKTLHFLVSGLFYVCLLVFLQEDCKPVKIKRRTVPP